MGEGPWEAVACLLDDLGAEITQERIVPLRNPRAMVDRARSMLDEVETMRGKYEGQKVLLFETAVLLVAAASCMEMYLHANAYRPSR